jgi:glycosyltransferase involved in cell wall biosynthesis
MTQAPLEAGDPNRPTFVWRPEPDAPPPGASDQPLFESPAGAGDPPWLTIAIPTYRRPVLIRETIASVLAQTDRSGIELLVVDDDPASEGVDGLLAAFPSLRDIAFRYYRNSANCGLFGNWNTSLRLARGAWVSILNDDDLLDPGFVAAIAQTLRADPAVDAVVCSLRFLDQRHGAGDAQAPVSRAERVRNLLRFGLAGKRRLRPAQMFFGSIAGSGLGLVVRTEVIRGLGGYRAADYPSADYFFMTRLARYHRFVQLRAALAISRVDDNVSSRPETQMGFLRCQAAVQRALLDAGLVPRWWRRIQPPAMGIALRHTNRYWHQSFDRQVVEDAIGTPVSLRHLRPVRWYRLLKGAI